MAVYFIENPINGLIKIGQSYKVNERLKALSKKCNASLKLLGVISGGFDIEGDLHIQFSADRVSGEWFKPVERLLEYIDKHAISLDNLVEVKPKPKQFITGKNNIPKLLKERQWTRYRLWKELDVMGSRDTVYHLGHPKAVAGPIPPKTQWGTLRRIAEVLGVGMNELESNERTNDD